MDFTIIPAFWEAYWETFLPQQTEGCVWYLASAALLRQAAALGGVTSKLSAKLNGWGKAWFVFEEPLEGEAAEPGP